MKTIKEIDGLQVDKLSNRRVYKLSRFLYRKNKLHESVNALKYLIRRGYSRPDVMFLLALCYDRISFLLKDIEYEDLAKETYEDLLQTCEKKRKRRNIMKEYNIFINRIYEFNEGEYNAYRKASQLKGDDMKTPKAWLLLGSNFNIRKDVDFVISSFQNAIVLDPNYMLALFRLGYVYQFNKNDENMALQYYVRLVKLNPGDDSNESETTNARCILEGCNQLGKIYFRKREYRKVVAVFNHALNVQNEYLQSSTLSLIRDLIYLADISANHINLKDKLDTHIKRNYYVSFNHLLNKYCREVSVA